MPVGTNVVNSALRTEIAVDATGSGCLNSLRNVDWVSKAVLYAPLISVTILAKFAIPPFGAQGIGISIPIMFIALAVGSLAGCIRIDAPRLTLFCGLMGFLGCVQILRNETFSAPSILLLAAAHLPYAFVLTRGRDYAAASSKFFLDIALLLACCGIAQYFLQSVINVRYLFPIENFLPKAYVVQKFNEQGVLSYGSDVYRANGIFLLEPSFLGQLLGTAVVVELCTLNRLHRLPVYGLALLAAHSGTGLMIVAACVPVFIISRRRWDLLFFIVATSILLFALRDPLHLDRLFARAGELGSTGSSGFARFIGGFYLFNQFLWNDPWRTLFGFGAGSFETYELRAFYPVAEMTLFKIVFEFGLVGAILYFSFLRYCLMQSSMPTLTKVAIGMGFFLNGVYGPFQHGLVLSLLVWSSSRGARTTSRFESSEKIQDFNAAPYEGSIRSAASTVPLIAPSG